MKAARIGIVVIGVLLPYAARIPGIAVHGWPWLTSYFGYGISAVLFFGVFNAICWGSILLATRSYRVPYSAIFPAALAFAWLAYAHGTLDLASDSTAALALIFIPIYSLPLVFIGWLLGLVFDWRWRRRMIA